MSELFDEGGGPRRTPPPEPRRSRALIITAVVLVVGFFALTTFSAFWTNRAWYDVVGFSGVFTTLLWTRVGLFAVFGGVMALVVGLNMYLAFRFRPLFRPPSPEQGSLDRYREVVVPIRLWLTIGVAALFGLFAGTSASSLWRQYLLWSNGSAPVPTLSVEALRVAQGASTLVVLGDTAGAGTVAGLRVGQFEVPTGPSGDMWLYYRNLPSTTYISAARLLADDYGDLAPLLAGHIVLVGASAAGLLDIRNNTLGEAVPGVSIHLQALEQMLTGTYLVRADWVGSQCPHDLYVIGFVECGELVGRWRAEDDVRLPGLRHRAHDDLSIRHLREHPPSE